MLCCLPREIRKQKDQNKKCEKIIKEYRRKQYNEIKLLLLGTSEAGKSTFIRQMKILYDNGFTDGERQLKIRTIHKNIFNSMQNMVRAMEMLGIEYEKRQNADKHAQLILYANFEIVTILEDPYFSAIKELWNDSGIQECYMRRREYQLNDSTKYYLTNIDRIAEPGYIPTDQDILRTRESTIGLVEHRFKINNANFLMVDVGGQRSERRKWMHCFDSVKSIIFLVAISEYDQVLVELDQRNRLVESIGVFKSITTKWFDDTSVILFLNKTDLFDEKIMNSHLDEFFPEFSGPRQDAKAARQFILDVFSKISPKLKDKMYYHFTCATDTKNIEVVFEAVRDIILAEHLRGFRIA